MPLRGRSRDDEPTEMNQQLAQAVIATFRDADRDAHVRRLASFDVWDWRRSMHWLDASGLALYFRSRLNFLALEESVPPEVVQALDSRLEDNRLRTAALFEEFEAINRAFQQAGLRYANLKGISLVPDYCPDPSLRCQFDLDFMMCESGTPACRGILNGLGYIETGNHDDVVEFKAGMEQACSIQDLYKPRIQRAVEVHFVPESQYSSASGGPSTWIQNQVWSGVVFPALSDAGKFLLQARHLFRHVKSEWTRISWLLEFRTFVASHRDETEFWKRVRQTAASSDEDALAVGIAVWLMAAAFGQLALPALTEWSLDVLPEPIRLWLECYGTRVLLADFPGTKLYLLLEHELSGDTDTRKVDWGKALPLHRPPRVTYPSEGTAGWKARAILSELRYMLFRLRFHIAESTRYVIEVQRWKRIMNGLPRVRRTT